MKNKTFTFVMGLLCGMVLLSSGYAAASTILSAAPSSQPIFVDGRQVQLEAYEIHGNNFVKLRDVGEEVGFNVYWDGAAVQMKSSKPYTGMGPVVQTPAPVPTPTPSAPVVPSSSASSGYTINTDHWSREDFSQRANSAVFTGVFDRALYNTIRQTLVDGGSGTAPAYTMVDKEDYGTVKRLLGQMDGTRRLEHYVPENFVNYYEYLSYFAVTFKTPEQYHAAQSFIQPAIAQARQLGSDREKVEYLHDYLCSLLSYDVKAVAVISEIFAPRNGEIKGACGAYATAFSFLCDAANIPCFSIRSTDHSWNMVYADGRWLYVDVSADDLHGNKNALLVETYPRHTDIAPQATAFLKELLVPGSTK